ncbi:MAG: glycosyltransferase family 2 protein [Clostridia bacterium]|nr:glycosyltransferase family 2 protein [Clostridia bacterium]
MAKISVIVPAYNSEQFIAETLENLLNQTLKDIEVIVVNDGSTDGTQKIIDEYCRKSDIFKSYIKENGGVSKARNYGLERATGEYVLFQDADDLYTEGSLEAFYETAKRTGADLVLGRLRTFGKNTVSKYNAFADKLASMEAVDNFDITLLWSFLVGNKCYKRDRLVESGVRFPGFRYSEEGAFFMSYVYTGAKIAGTMDATMCYRRHTEEEGLSVSQTVNEELARSFSGSLKVIYDGAVKAVENAPDTFDKKEYIQEVIYKTAYILLSQFYRLCWRSDDGCMTYCAEEFERLRSLMTEKRFKIMQQTDADLHLENIFRTRKEIAEKPGISVIIRKSNRDMTALLDSIYSQICPMFEVIVPQSMVDKGLIPEKYLTMENLRILPDKKYMKNARRSARAKRVVSFLKPRKLDIRDFRLTYRFRKIPDKLKEIFFPVMLRGIDFLLTKRIVK